MQYVVRPLFKDWCVFMRNYCAKVNATQAERSSFLFDTHIKLNMEYWETTLKQLQQQQTRNAQSPTTSPTPPISSSTTSTSSPKLYISKSPVLQSRGSANRNVRVVGNNSANSRVGSAHTPAQQFLAKSPIVFARNSPTQPPPFPNLSRDDSSIEDSRSRRRQMLSGDHANSNNSLNNENQQLQQPHAHHHHHHHQPLAQHSVSVERFQFASVSPNGLGIITGDVNSNRIGSRLIRPFSATDHVAFRKFSDST
eukprot:c7929_g1_i1.p1 GENE.c7929_g1_i1~~c7929_g1_i1.p1  ORF type:complete len:253 (-),score=75.88 c7929_g1_i1:234-992(-)